MAEREHAEKFNQISSRAFDLHLKDLDTLKNRFARVEIDVSRLVLAKMKRSQLIHAILANEFGAEAVMDYISQCREWDEMKALVEHHR